MLTLEEQHQYLQQVSRTFALTIPLIKGSLSDAIANAYLICRIADTMEDDPIAAPQVKAQWLRRFARELDAGFADDEALLLLQDEARRILKAGAVPEEYKLSCNLFSVLQRTRSFEPQVQRIIGHGAAVLSRGMARQLTDTQEIQDLPGVDRYCYAVAGVVGELLALLFIKNSPVLSEGARKELLNLSVSFGEGLQLTNILKDRSADDLRAVSFLPRTEAQLSGADLILHYCAVAQGHLLQAGQFTCLLDPRTLYGVRFFCLLNIAMAVLTLKKIEARPLGTQQELKISRSAVKRCLRCCALCARFNWTTRMLLAWLRRGSTMIVRDAAELRRQVSLWEHEPAPDAD